MAPQAPPPNTVDWGRALRQAVIDARHRKRMRLVKTAERITIACSACALLASGAAAFVLAAFGFAIMAGVALWMLVLLIGHRSDRVI